MVRTLMPSLIACVAFASLGHAADAAPPTPSTSPPVGVQSELAALAALAVAHGFPDAAGGRIVRGQISVAHGNDGNHIERQDGLHLILADGRWLIGMARLASADAVRADTAALTAVTPEQLPEFAAALAQAQGWADPAMMEQFIAQIAPADRERVRAAQGALPVLFASMMAGVADGTLAIHLIRLGAPCAGDVAILSALAEAWNTLSPDPWVAAPLRLTVDLAWLESEATSEPTDLPVPPAEVSLRRAIFRFFRTRALVGETEPMRSEAGEPAAPATPGSAAVTEREAALAVAETLLAGDAPVARAELELIRGRLRLPISVAPDAPLAERLALWDGALVGSDPEIDDVDDPTAQAEAMAMLGLPVNGDTPLAAGAGDLDALLGLLEDPRPCSWLDFGRARTLGDNALRAIGAIVGCDPRSLIGRDPEAAWTAEERAATASALRTWWAANRERPIDDLVLEHVPELRPREVARLLRGRPPERRGGLLAKVASAWVGGPPHGLDEATLAAVLNAAGGDAGLAAAIAGWPVDGDLAIFLAAFHLTRGERAPFAALLDAALATREEHDYRLVQLLALLRHAPTPADLQRLVSILRDPLDHPETANLVEAVLSGQGWSGHAIRLVAEWQRGQLRGDHLEAERRSQLLPTALYAVVLADERPASEPLRRRAESTRLTATPVPGDAAAPAALAPDLRVADIAGAAVPHQTWQFRRLLGEELRGRATQLAVDPSKPKAERDRQLAELRRLIGDQLAPALAEAGLPDLAPAGGPPPGDEESLF